MAAQGAETDPGKAGRAARPDLSTGPEIKVKGGKTIDANDKTVLNLAGSDASQSTVSVMTYSVTHADPIPPMVLK